MSKGVYKITNPKGSIYVGSSKNLEWRLRCYRDYPQHLKNQHKIKNSLLKYGPDAHEFEILCECEEKELLKKEREIGIKLNVLARENMNLMLPKLGENGPSLNEETRLKMKRSGKIRALREAKKRSLIAKNTFRGKKQSKEHVEKRKLFGEKNPMFGKKGPLHPNFGKKFNKAIREKFSKAQKKHAQTEGYVNGRSRAVVNVSTSEIFVSVKQAANSVPMNYRTLMAMLTGQNPNRTTFKFINKKKSR